jgi:hypothetical protein
MATPPPPIIAAPPAPEIGQAIPIRTPGSPPADLEPESVKPVAGSIVNSESNGEVPRVLPPLAPLPKPLEHQGADFTPATTQPETGLPPANSTTIAPLPLTFESPTDPLPSENANNPANVPETLTQAVIQNAEPPAPEVDTSKEVAAPKDAISQDQVSPLEVQIPSMEDAPTDTSAPPIPIPSLESLPEPPPPEDRAPVEAETPGIGPEPGGEKEIKPDFNIVIESRESGNKAKPDGSPAVTAPPEPATISEAPSATPTPSLASDKPALAPPPLPPAAASVEISQHSGAPASKSPVPESTSGTSEPADAKTPPGDSIAATARETVDKAQEKEKASLEEPVTSERVEDPTVEIISPHHPPVSQAAPETNTPSPQAKDSKTAEGSPSTEEETPAASAQEAALTTPPVEAPEEAAIPPLPAETVQEAINLLEKEGLGPDRARVDQLTSEVDSLEKELVGLKQAEKEAREKADAITRQIEEKEEAAKQARAVLSAHEQQIQKTKEGLTQ